MNENEKDGFEEVLVFVIIMIILLLYKTDVININL